MKKEQKIIEINNEKNIKLANERAEYAEQREGFAAGRYSVKADCAELMRGVTDENKRGDILANRAARIAKIEMMERDCEARHRRKVAMILLSAADKIKEAEGDPEEEKPQPSKDPTVWLDGSHHSAVITARRILNKLPKLNYPQEMFYLYISPSFSGGTSLEIKYINTIDKAKGICSCELTAKDEPEIQAKRVELWLTDVDLQMERAKAIKESEGKEGGDE